MERIINTIKNIYNWYYYVETTCYKCKAKIYIDKNTYFGDVTNCKYTCSNTCMYFYENENENKLSESINYHKN